MDKRCICRQSQDRRVSVLFKRVVERAASGQTNRGGVLVTVVRNEHAVQYRISGHDAALEFGVNTGEGNQHRLLRWPVHDGCAPLRNQGWQVKVLQRHRTGSARQAPADRSFLGSITGS